MDSTLDCAFNPYTDYSNFHSGCSHCGKILSQVQDTRPRPCPACGLAHYCSPRCLLIDLRTTHRPKCKANQDAEIDVEGAQTLSSPQALWDLRKYTARWRDELGDAAIDAMNLHADPTAIDRLALIVNLSYIPEQWHRMQRFQIHRAVVKPLKMLTGPSMDKARVRQREYTVKNRELGMVGSALIVLVCNVPEVGYIINATFVGPEPDLLVEPPAPDWEEKLLAAVRVNVRDIRPVAARLQFSPL